MISGGATCTRLKCVNGQSPDFLHAAANAAIGAASAPDALNGTSGSRVSRSRTSSIAQKSPRPRTSPTDGCVSVKRARRGAMTRSPRSRTRSRMPSRRNTSKVAMPGAQANGCPE